MRIADTRLGRRRLLATAAAALAIPAAVAQPAVTDFQGERMVVNSFGGPFGAAWKQHVVEPFQKKFNAQLAVVDAITGEVTAKVLASRNNPQLDVVILGDSGAAVLAQQGLFEPLTEATVPNLRDLLNIARLPGDVYAEFLFASEVLVYNKNQISTPPTSWNDLFDPKYKQRILIPDLGNSVSGPVDPGFEALKRLKPNAITYWTSMQQIATMLSSGEAWLGIWSSDRAAALIQSGAPVALAQLKEKPALFGNAIGTVKGTKHLKLAQAYVNYVLSAEVQGNVLSAIMLAPTNKNAVLADAAKPFVADPRGAEVIDWAAVAKDMPAWLDRWNRTITQ